MRVSVGRAYGRTRATRWLATTLSTVALSASSVPASADPTPAVTPVPSPAASAPDNVPGTLVQMVDVVPGAAPQVAAATANLASAVLQAAPSGAQFRVTVMPGYLARDYIEVLSEAKITAVTSVPQARRDVTASAGTVTAKPIGTR